MAMDRAYVDYGKFESLTENGVVYVTKLKRSLKYTVQKDVMCQDDDGRMAYRVQDVTFTKEAGKGNVIVHHARIVTYADVKKTRAKLISLLSNDMEMDAKDIVDIYRKRWEIELLFKQLKQNFPLRYFYGESANAIKIQIWVTLIANLLLMVVQKRVKGRTWGFSGLATMVRITLMYYINCYSFLSNPGRDWERLIEHTKQPPVLPSLFD